MRVFPQIKDSPNPLREIEIVGDDHQGDTLFFLNLEKKVGDLGAGFAVERSRRFIGEDDSGFVDEGARHGGPLFLATGEFPGAVVQAMAETHLFQESGGAFSGFFLAFLPAASEAGNKDVLHHGELRKEMVLLENKAQLAVPEPGGRLFIEGSEIGLPDPNRPGGRRKESPENIEQGGLATSRRANHRGGLATIHGKIQPPENVNGFSRCLKTDFKIADLDHGSTLTDNPGEQRMEF